MSEPQAQNNHPPEPENQDKKSKFGQLTAKDAARRQLEDKGQKWDSADWAMEAQNVSPPPKT